MYLEHHMCDDFDRCGINEKCEDYPGGFKCVCPIAEGYKKDSNGDCVCKLKFEHL